MIKRIKLKNRHRNALTGYLFISPFIIGFISFMVVPLFESLRMSFSNVVVGIGNAGFKMEWTGLANYQKALFVHPDYNRWLVEELSKMGVQVPAIMIVSFFMALLINQEFKEQVLIENGFKTVATYSPEAVYQQFSNMLNSK